MLVADLSSYGASAPSVEVERRKLRVLELMRFKEFRQTMLEKLKRKATAVGKGAIESEASRTSNQESSDTAALRLPSSSFLQTPGMVSKRGSIESHTGSSEAESGDKEGKGTANADESVDINVDVQV